MAEKARHAYGKSENLQNALDSGAIDAFDILFLDSETDPKIGWVDKSGNPIIVKSTTELEGQVAELETEIESKISTEEAEAKINEVVTEKVNTVVTETVETIVTEKVETVVNEIDSTMDEKVEEAISSANSYTDEKIAEITTGYEIIEF